jgi:tetratricopeptide (TPR) repeat protein
MNAMKYSDVYVMTMLSMAHADFSSYSMRMRQDNEFGDYTRAEISVAHSWAMRYTRHFLDAYLKGDAAGLAFLNNTPATNKVPPHMVLTDVRRKQDIVPATLENYVRRLASVGFDQAVPVYQQFSAQDAGFKLDPNQLYGWGLQLYRLNRLPQAREIFRLGVHLYPELSFMMDGLAEMQAKTGQEQEASKSYRRVLELDPKNVDAAKYLKEHGA